MIWRPLFVPALLQAKLYFAPPGGYPCCCSEGLPVPGCTFCDPQEVPQQVQLTLSGVTNDIYCNNCDGYNKSWILDYQGYNSGSGGNSCWYQLSLYSTSPCGAPYHGEWLTAYFIYESSGNYRTGARRTRIDYHCVETLDFRKDHTGPQNCLTYDETLPFLGYDIGGQNPCRYCIWDNATCRLESL